MFSLQSWLVSMAMMLAASPLSAEIEVIDDTGHEVRLADPARRIVSLAPHLTEILFAIGAGERIVGTVRYADYPAEAQRIPRLGDAFSVSVEAVMAARPDVVVAWETGGSMGAVERLRELGVVVYVNEAPRLEDIPVTIQDLGKLTGQQEQADKLARQFRLTLEALARQHADARPVRVFFQISDERLYTVAGSHLISQAIDLCGGENVFADSPVPVPLVSQEAVLAARPHLAVVTEVEDAPQSRWKSHWQSAGMETRGIDPDLISRPGIRMLAGVEQMCEFIDAARDDPMGREPRNSLE